MKTNILRVLILGTFIFLFAACSNSGTDEGQESSNVMEDDNVSVEGNYTNRDGEEIDINNIDDLSDAISDALQGLNDGKKVQATDFRKLKELLPERIAGMKRVSIEGEKTGLAELKYSVAKAEYEKGDTRVDISVLDGAGFAGIINGFAAWALVEIDRETESGFERTTEIGGYKAFEQYDADAQDGQLSVILEERFILNIEGRNLKNEVLLRDIFKDFNVKKLKNLPQD
jgi:hypothetical protein